LLLAAGAIVSFSTSAWAVGSGFGPTPLYAAQVNGDFVAAGTGTRTFAGFQTEPFNLSLAWPGSVVKAYAHWTYLSMNPSAGTAAEAGITINSTPVVGTLTGNSPTADLGWSYAGTTTYTADVTSLVSAAGPGVFSIGSATDIAGTGPHNRDAVGEGFSLTVVYNDGGPARLVHLYAGEVQNTGSVTATSTGTMGFSAPYTGGNAHFLLNAMDGQASDDWFFINGTNVSGTFPGTTSSNNAWGGLLGPGPNGGNGIKYDHADGLLGGLLLPGATSLTFKSDVPPSSTTRDIIGHSWGAISFPVAIPEPACCMLAGIGIFAGSAGIRRRVRHS
jgi:hypothetical protein